MLPLHDTSAVAPAARVSVRPSRNQCSTGTWFRATARSSRAAPRTRAGRSASRPARASRPGTRWRTARGSCRTGSRSPSRACSSSRAVGQDLEPGEQRRRRPWSARAARAPRFRPRDRSRVAPRGRAAARAREPCVLLRTSASDHSIHAPTGSSPSTGGGSGASAASARSSAGPTLPSTASGAAASAAASAVSAFRSAACADRWRPPPAGRRSRGAERHAQPLARQVHGRCGARARCARRTPARRRSPGRPGAAR